MKQTTNTQQGGKKINGAPRKLTFRKDRGTNFQALTIPITIRLLQDRIHELTSRRLRQWVCR